MSESTFTQDSLLGWEVWLNEVSFNVAMAFFVFELLRLLVLKKLKWNLIGDSITNFITLTAFIGISFVVAVAFYITVFYWAYEFSVVQLPMNMTTLLVCIVLADFTYYWEHRFMHRVGFGWATHTVHHSSPYFNISVAYRFGPLDGIIPILFHLPLALIGFDPVMIFVAEIIVQIYQTLLHTEVIKKLPRPIEAVFNTPSHHRVHHGANPQYIDKNYAGIFIIWDRMFGTFEEEDEPVRYGLTKSLDSINPFVVFFHGLTNLGRNVLGAKDFKTALAYVFRPPGWEPDGDVRDEQ